MLKNLILIPFLFISLSSVAQSMSGPSSASVNDVMTYSYNSGGSYLPLGSWSVTGGTIVGNSDNGTNTVYADIRWDDAGTQTVKFSNPFNGAVYDQMNVSVALDPGTIGNAQTVCYNGNPAAISNVASADAGGASVIYRWDKLEEGNANYTTINGATGATYNPGTLTKTTYYKRYARLSGDLQYYASNRIKITVRPNLQAGSINNSNNNSDICYNANPGSIYSSGSPSGGDGNYTYKWRKRVNSGSWSWISNSNSAAYSPGNLTADTDFQRRVTSCGQSKYSNVVFIDVASPMNAGSIEGDKDICYNSGTALASTQAASGGLAGATYVWWRKIGSGAWEELSSQNGSGYLDNTPGTTVKYKREAIFNGCGSVFSNVSTVTRLALVSAGTISGPVNTCYNTAPARIEETQAPAGGDGVNYTFQWESAPPGGNYTTISGATNAYLDPAAITSDTWYRRKVSSCGSTVTSNAVFIEALDALSPGSIYTPEDTVLHCKGFDPVNITAQTSPTGGTGTYSYQWQSSPDGNQWTDITGATNASFDPGPQAETIRFRRLTTSGSCTPTASNEVVIAAELSAPEAGVLTGTTDFYNSGTVDLSYIPVTGQPQSYIWERQHGSTWSMVQSGSGTTFSEGAQEGRAYRVVAQNSCGSDTSNVVYVNILDFGQFLVNSTHFWGEANGAVSINGYDGVIDKWQLYENASWSDIGSSAGTYTQNFNNKTADFKLRVVINGTPSDAIEVSVEQEQQYMEIAGPDAVYASAPTGTLQALNAIGTVKKWQFTTDNIQVHDYTTTSNTYLLDTITTDTYFRVVTTQNGVDYYSDWKYVKYIDALDESLPQSLFIKTESLTVPVNDEGSITTGDVITTFSYFDGLGRTVQQVVKGQSSSQNDIVSFQEYDAYGRSTKSYLPFTSSGNDYYTNLQTAQATFYNGSTANVPADNSPFAEVDYGDSPRQRVLEQGAVGDDWQLTTGHTVKYDVSYNTANEVRKWDASGISTGYYGANQLIKNVVTDENGNRVKTYTDSRGRKILKQVEESTGNWLSTYQIFDAMGKLIYTIPPKAVATLGVTGTLDVNHASVANLIYSYTYDGKGRLVEKQVPGAGKEYIVYDLLDRVALTQDANMRTNNQWYFTKYDVKGRPVYSGVYTNTTQTTRTDVQALFDGLDYNTDAYYEVTEANASTHGYSNTVFPTGGLELLSVNYYDTYDFDRNGTDDYSYDNTHLSGQETGSTIFRGMATGSKTKILDTDEWLVNVVFYDSDGQAIQTLANNHKNLSVADKTSMLYNWKGEVTQVKSTVNGANDVIEVKYRYTYDHAGRVLAIDHTVNNEEEIRLVAYSYNELGQVIKKDLHLSPSGGGAGGGPLQSIDYAYNIRGWLKSINDPDNMNSQQLFGMELFYNDSLGGLAQTTAHNGNITAMKWKNNLSASSETQAYAYDYDKSDRLKKADYGEGAGFLQSAQHYALSAMQYDVNGNINSMTRKAPDATGLATDMDNLSYTYDGNQMTKVDDAGGAEGFTDQNVATEYVYDNNGNMITDENKGIDHIYYNVLNKPDSIVMDTVSIKYIYDASGTKLAQKTYINSTLQKTTDYIGSMLYENDELQFFGHSEGRVVYDPLLGFEYQYAYTDHLGNTRLIYTSKPKTVNFTLNYEGLGDDENNFEDVAKTNNDIFDHTDAAGTTYNHSQMLNGTDGSRIGSVLAISVGAGDTITASVFAKYVEITPDATNATVSIASALIGAFTGNPGVSAGEAGTGTINNNFGDGSLIGSTGFGVENSSAPMAFLNMMFLPARESIDLVKGSTFAFDQIDISATQGINEPKNTNYDELRIDGFVAPDNGYIMVYLSNEGSNVTEVYFDDLSVEVNEGLVRQVNNYYPFGLQHNSSWTRPTDLKNNFLYNAGSELNELTSNYETFFRQYDAALGRFTAIDPVAAKYGSQTPYNYAFNDPIALNDPMGDDPLKDQREFYGENYQQQMGYFWDENPNYHGDVNRYTPVTYDIGTANFNSYDPSSRMQDWYESMPEYGMYMEGVSMRADFRAVMRALEGKAGILLNHSGLGIDLAKLGSGSYKFSLSKGIITGFSSKSYSSIIGASINQGSYGTLYGNNLGTTFYHRNSNGQATVAYGDRLLNAQEALVQELVTSGAATRSNDPYFGSHVPGDHMWNNSFGKHGLNLRMPSIKSDKVLQATAGANAIIGAGYTITGYQASPLYYGPKEWARMSTASRSAGIKFGLFGLGLTAIDIGVNGLNTSNSLDGIFGTVSLAGPVGATIGGVYFGANLITIGISGRTIGQHVDDYYWVSLPGMGVVPIGRKSK